MNLICQVAIVFCILHLAALLLIVAEYVYNSKTKLPLINLRIVSKKATFGGNLLIITTLGLSVSGLTFIVYYLFDKELGLISNISLGLFMFLSIVSVLFGIVASWKNWAVIVTNQWTEPLQKLEHKDASYCPMVSIQIPTYSEPPELVKQTLDAIKSQHYLNFEVIVIDNNTKDSNLWKPVKDYCQQLGPKFRFYHVSPLDGAKAGALNYVEQLVHPDATIIGVIDADYQVTEDWITSIIDYFKDPKVAFVQPPQAYRDWANSKYKRMLNWEYHHFFATGQPLFNECNAPFIVGTTSLIRREALIKVGGWATWCQTEDTELSVRLHLAGYTSVAVSNVLGRGLIPETFEDYRKQRFRWNFGHMQELIKHKKAYLPAIYSCDKRMKGLQKISHFCNAIDEILALIKYLQVFTFIVFSILLLVDKHVIDLPMVWLIVMITQFLELLINRALVYHRAGAKISDSFWALLANRALLFTNAYAVLMNILPIKIPRWHRTNKFKINKCSTPIACFLSTAPENLIGILLLSASISLLFLTPTKLSIIHICIIQAFILGISHFSALIIALLSNQEISKNLKEPC